MNWHRIGYFLASLTLVVAVMAFTTGYRSLRMYRGATEVRESVRYLMENGGTIGQAPAESALSDSYLEIVFGEDPELLEQLKKAVERGSAAMPDVRQGEIAAIIVTYRKNGDDKIENVVAHLAGGFPLGTRRISMHRDGFFAHQLDRHLWTTGDSGIRFLGRDLVVWANNEEDEKAQRELIESVFSGEVIILADSIAQKPLYYSMVFPSPEQVVPAKMRNHIRAILVNGYLAPDRGSMELVVLTKSEVGTALVGSMMNDLKVALQVALRTRFAGVLIESPWGPHVPVWWAYEMANTLEDVEITRRDRTIRMSSQYERRMVNATLKTIERFGRDFSQIKGVTEDKLDPRVVDARMQTRKPNHYWSEAHKWGPDWPFGSGTNIVISRPGEEDRTLDAAPPVTQPF